MNATDFRWFVSPMLILGLAAGCSGNDTDAPADTATPDSMAASPWSGFFGTCIATSQICANAWLAWRVSWKDLPGQRVIPNHSALPILPVASRIEPTLPGYR